MSWRIRAWQRGGSAGRSLPVRVLEERKEDVNEAFVSIGHNLCNAGHWDKGRPADKA